MTVPSRADLINYELQKEDDEVVCAFGPDYFNGARWGSAWGGLGSLTCCLLAYRRLRKDQREVDYDMGLRKGQANKHFSRWVVLRGLRTQPMLATGCVGLAVTSTFKLIKFYLSSARCSEFWFDDMAFEQMAPKEAEELKAYYHSQTFVAGRDPSSKPAAPTTVAALMKQAEVARPPQNRESPTFADGVAVGLLGSVLDCYVPQKPISRYYHMRFGY
ncbi:hypothetical protein STCU_01009 [Strigomonas culicis]|uniref:Uncharacterized protein n=1 Tax=Strigomonas culicis TaxID=28005 RepID=S9WIH3_9TRYP|nr:hypothetical protein STCU_01631 [Strigomonas culicis]EPY35665.1 hypothetical protein STCU_01009 [Strigomonas culicis]|eukprot:EPY34345.1 hypothetical protein STCU_01631 [Strigomonas culicis]